MSIRNSIVLLLLLAASALPALSQIGQSDASARLPRGQRAAGDPHLYVATGPSSNADLDRLRAAIGKATGVVKVDAHAEFDAITVTIETDGRAPESVVMAAATSVGFAMQPVLDRFYAATGPKGDADLSRLRTALEKVPGVERVDVGEHADGAAVRIFGVMGHDVLMAAGKSAGFGLRALGAYVASGPSAKADLTRLRSALTKVRGVEKLEMQGLVGGATLLVYGDVQEPVLAQVGKSVGYALRPLGNAPGARLFQIEGSLSTVETQKLSQVLKNIDGIGEIDVKTDSHGQRVSVAGGKARPNGIVEAAAGAGFVLTPVQIVALPSLLPTAERSTPPDYDKRAVEEYANVGEMAPPFTLLTGDGGSKISLSDYVGKKPVILIFGSCTCPPFRSYIASLERLHASYKDRVAFLLVYIQEAHPGSIIAVPTQGGGEELQIIPPTGTVSERLQNVRRFISALKVTIPVVIDGEDNAAKIAFAGWPIRLYAVGIDGKIAYKGGPGPNGFKVPELAAWLHENVK